MKIWLCTEPTDMRRLFDGLSAEVKQVLHENAASGALFVFINRRRTQMKCLYYEAGGYCLWSKRLAQGQIEMLVLSCINKQRKHYKLFQKTAV